MNQPERFPFTPAGSFIGDEGILPHIPLTLTRDERSISVIALLDTGATINVLPDYSGTRLGVPWERLTTPLHLAGNLGRYEARAIYVQASIGNFTPTRLLFAWTRSNDVPVILGQVNFFVEFDVCFYGSQSAFEIQPKQPQGIQEQ